MAAEDADHRAQEEFDRQEEGRYGAGTAEGLLGDAAYSRYDALLSDGDGSDNIP